MKRWCVRRHAASTVLLALCLAWQTEVAGAEIPSRPAEPTVKPPPRGRVPARRPPARARQPSKPPLEQAREARTLEELGAYAQAAEALQQLRGIVPPDADLEIALAIDQARTGRLDSATVQLWGPVLSAAFEVTSAPPRRRRYPWQREEYWINGQFDGWSWYVARARAEVAAARGRWNEALEAARRCVEERPLAGKEWLILAVAAARTGHADESARAVTRAIDLDASLPEAQYIHGLLEWRAGRRNAAQAAFRAAVELDSSYRAPALALVRSKLPGVSPDTLPGQFLNGIREADLLTSPLRPKQEEFIQMDVAAQPIRQDNPAVPDSLKGTFTEARLALSILIDERGRVVLHDLPWFDPALIPEPLVGLTTRQLPQWRFKPASKLGVPQRLWSGVMVTIPPN